MCSLRIEIADYPFTVMKMIACTCRSGFGRHSGDDASGEPLIYASMGTIRNGRPDVFRTIVASLVKRKDLQLVLSLGDQVDPKQIGAFPKNAIIVKRAPQLELLKQASVCITHAGLNTVLESLAQGVPQIAIPIAADQPGVGAMARTIGDVALGHSILKGPDGIDGYAIHARDAEPDSGRLAGQPIRVGWVSDAAFGPVDPEITAAVAAAAAQLADLGYEVEEVTLPFVGKAFGALATLVYGEIVPSIKALAAGRESELHAVGAGTIGLSDPSFVDFAAAHAQAETLRSAFSGFFRKYDVLLTPVNPMTATPHGAQEVVVNGVTVPWTHVMAATSPFNLAGLPALAVPYGFSSENLPIDIQLVANWLDEVTIMRVGAMLERRGGLGNRRPLI